MYETYTMFYDNERAMRWGIANMQKQGWEVVSVKATDQGWSCLKTGCLGCLFLPLALLGKKEPHYDVRCRRKLAHDRRGQTTK